MCGVMCPKFAPRLHSLRSANCTRAVWNWKNKSIGNFYRCNCHFKDSSEGAVFSFMEIVILFCTYILHVSYPSYIYIVVGSPPRHRFSKIFQGKTVEALQRKLPEVGISGISWEASATAQVAFHQYHQNLTLQNLAPHPSRSLRGKKKYSWTKVNDVRRMLGLWEALATSSVVHHWISNH